VKELLLFISCFFIAYSSHAQETSLDYFLGKAKQNNDSLYSSESLQKIGQLQEQMINAQNRAPQVDAFANLIFAPYFDNNGKVIDISTNPSPNAFGYDAGISNGGLYATQLKVTQQLFNGTITNNLLFQNQVQNDGFALTYEEVYHNLKYNITRLYVTAYGFQLQEQLNQNLLVDLEKRLKIIGILVKNGILLQSDYLLVQVNLDQTKIQLQQVRNNLSESIRQLYSFSAAPIDQNTILSLPSLAIMAKKQGFFFEKRFVNDSLQVEANRTVFNNKYKPKVSAFVDGGLNAVQIPNIYRKIGASAGLQFNLPIYDGHQRKINAQQSAIRKEILLNSLKNNETVKLNNLQSLLDQITAQVENLNLMDQQLKKLDLLMQLYKEKLVKGQVSVIDYLNVIQNYKMQENARIQMQTNLWLLQNQYNYINW
jgi:outer membrane protein TolC